MYKEVSNKVVSLSFIISFSLVSCTLPFEIYLQNDTDQSIMVYAHIRDKEALERLPNKISFYKIDKERTWVKDTLVTWTDQDRFQLRLPLGEQIKISQITDELVFGLSSPRVEVKTDNELIFSGEGDDFHKLYNANRWERLDRKTFLIILK